MGGIVAILRAALGLGLGAVAAGAVLPLAGGDLAAETAPAGKSPLAGFPGLGRTYHHVSGRTVEEIRASLNRLELVDDASGKPVDAYTRWYLSWWIPEDPGGECLLDQAEVMLDVTVGLPRLVNVGAVPADVRQRWRDFIAALEAHEATHVRSLYRARRAMLHAIRDADCATADQAASEVMDAMRLWNEAYDRRTRHGLTEGTAFP